MLGHGFTDSILEHPYYGTELVINDLKENYGWYTGKVVMCDTDVKFIKEKNKLSESSPEESANSITGIILNGIKQRN